MNKEQQKLTPALIEELRNKGLTQNEIAALFGVSRQYVSKLKHKYGRFSKSPREVALENYPWKTGERFHDASVNKRMRDHAEFMATGGKGMSLDKRKRLNSFYNFLQSNDYVVEFDPSIPPSPGISTGGFAFRKRESSDGDLIIRVNEHTTLTPKGRVIWRYPPERPSVA